MRACSCSVWRGCSSLGAGVPAIWKARHSRGAASRAALPVMILDDILFSDRALEADGSVTFQLTDDGYNLLLRSLHFLDLDGAEGVHVLLQHFSAPLGHGRHEVIPKLVACALQRDSHQLAVD